MAAPRSDTGAIPAVKLATLDSDVHHLRGQTDLDRRSLADLRADVRTGFNIAHDQIANLRLFVGTLDSATKEFRNNVGEALARIEVAQAGLAKSVGELKESAHKLGGGLGLGKWLVGAVGLLEAARWLFEGLR